MPLAVPSRVWELDSFARCLSLRDLASLSSARKEWQYSILLLYRSPLVRQLVQAVVACIHVPGYETELAGRQLTLESLEGSPAQQLQHLWTLVSFLQADVNAPWGPALAATPGLCEDLTQLFTVPQLPDRVQHYFAWRFKLRINTQQLFSAAGQRVAGVESWVKKELYNEPQRHLRSVVDGICCNHTYRLHLAYLQPQRPKDAADYLQLAFNCRSHSTASSVAANLLPRITNTAVLLDLMRTAVLRHHSNVLKMVLTIPAAKRLAPAAVLQLMQAAVEKPWESDNILFGDNELPLVHWLVQLPAAAKLTSEQLVPLLQTASDRCYSDRVAILCTLPAANDISPHSLVSILEPAVAHWSDKAVCALCSLSAAAALTINDLLPLIASAMTTDRQVCHIRGMFSLPAAQQIPVNVLTSLLEHGVQWYSNMETVAMLCSLPAAADLSGEAWMSITKAALRWSCNLGLEALCQLPAATCVAPAEFAAVLQAAIAYERLSAVRVLCQSPAAKGISSEHILQLVRQLMSTAELEVEEYPLNLHRVEQHIHNVSQALVALEVVQNMCAAEVIELFKIWNEYPCGVESSLRIWFMCHAVCSMSIQTLVQHMQQSIHQRDCELLHLLFRLPVAAQLDACTLLQLFDSALKVDGSIWVVMQKCLTAAPATSQLTGRQLAAVLTAIVNKDDILAPKLCAVPAASTLLLVEGRRLLKTAVQHQNSLNVERLCELQVLQQASWYDVQVYYYPDRVVV